MPPFVTAHTFCASRDSLRDSSFLRTAPTNAKVAFARFMTIKEKQILARAVGIIQKENWDNHAFFRDI